MKYVLGVGTNMGERMNNIERCIDSINLTPYTDVLICSAVYETEPVGYARQQNFYNCALLVESELEPNEMLGLCLGIESGFGRKRGFANGPRILDIDLLLAEGVCKETRNLTVPHPEIRKRRFVLLPLLDIFPDGKAFGYEFASYIDKIEGQLCEKIKEKKDYYL